VLDEVPAVSDTPHGMTPSVGCWLSGDSFGPICPVCQGGTGPGPRRV